LPDARSGGNLNLEKTMNSGAIRVLIIDDSPIVHTVLAKVFESQPDIQVAGNAFDGREGVKLARELEPDIIIMDITMPGMSGLEAIEEIMVEKPAPVIVFSSASRDIVDLGFKAIGLGAVDLVEKPAARDLTELKEIIENKLLRTVRTFADFKVIRRFRRHRLPAVEKKAKSELLPFPPREQPIPTRAPAAKRAGDESPAHSRVIAVASSTGGPQILRQLLSHPGLAALDASIVLVQHLADGFVEGFADWLRLYAALPVIIACEGEKPEPGLIQVAPGGCHLGIDPGGRFAFIRTPPVFGIRPSADVLFESMAGPLRHRLVAVVLSGMGSDGTEGIKKVKEHGGFVIAQDEESSLIFGMPKAAIDSGNVDAVLNISELPDFLLKICGTEPTGHAG
jgi:two-component system chemotaxis response regulator CheB